MLHGVVTDVFVIGRGETVDSVLLIQTRVVMKIMLTIEDCGDGLPVPVKGIDNVTDVGRGELDGQTKLV